MARAGEQGEQDGVQGTPGPIARLVNVRKAFGTQVVLDGINLDIPTARTTVVMGPSGCGKSVMLKHLVGLLTPDAGEIYYGERRIDALSESEFTPIRLEVALVFQGSALFDSMSVAENVEFPLLEHTRLSERERAERVESALERVDMGGTQSKLPAQLSGGQKRRVALARALVLEPRMVLFDEPTTGLDPVRADGINELILRLKRDLGVTNLVVTHDLTSARKIADHCVMLLGGRIAAAGAFAELEQSSDPRVQHFLRAQYDHDDEVLVRRNHTEAAR